MLIYFRLTQSSWTWCTLASATLRLPWESNSHQLFPSVTKLFPAPLIRHEGFAIFFRHCVGSTQRTLTLCCGCCPSVGLYQGIVSIVLKDLSMKDLIQLQFEKGMAGDYDDDEKDSLETTVRHVFTQLPLLPPRLCQSLPLVPPQLLTPPVVRLTLSFMEYRKRRSRCATRSMTSAPQQCRPWVPWLLIAARLSTRT